MKNYPSPVISVVMSSYNSKKFIEKSIISILRQTFENFELIIIDDFSTDDSVEIIKKYSRRDKRIKFIQNKTNLGAAASRNIALKISTGKYIAIMDADDIAVHNRLRTEYDYLEEHPQIFLIGSSAIIIDKNGKRLGVFKKFSNSKKLSKKLRISNPIIHPSIMFRNEGAFLYRTKFKTSEDYDLYLRILSSGRKIINIPDFLIKYRISKKSLTSTIANQAFYFKKAKEYYLQRLKNREDGYDSIDIPTDITTAKERNTTDIDFIFMKLLDGQGKSVRKNIKIIFAKYGGMRKRLLFYYVLSMFPKKIIWKIQELA